MMSVEKGVFAAAAKNPAMPTITKLAGCGTSHGKRLWNMIPMAPPPHPPITIEGPNTLPWLSICDGQARGENLAHGDGQQDHRRGITVLRHGVLNRGVAEGKHGQHLYILSSEKIQTTADQPCQKRTQCRSKMAVDGQPVKQPLDAIEGMRVEHGQQSHEQGQEQVLSDGNGLVKLRLGMVNKGSQPEKVP